MSSLSYFRFFWKSKSVSNVSCFGHQPRSQGFSRKDCDRANLQEESCGNEAFGHESLRS